MTGGNREHERKKNDNNFSKQFCTNFVDGSMLLGIFSQKYNIFYLSLVKINAETVDYFFSYLFCFFDSGGPL